LKEIREMVAEVRTRLGPGARVSLSYVAATLRAGGWRVNYEDRFTATILPEPYAMPLQGLPHFHDLAAAEDSLRQLDTIYREYLAADDRMGLRLIRSLVIKAKDRARAQAASARVSPRKRAEKLEVAEWFRVWLETPGLFTDWLELRKSSEEFRAQFPAAGAPES
jgi:hypothetical protein